MELIRLGTPPSRREGDLRSATNCTCPDLFVVPREVARTLNLGNLAQRVISEAVEATPPAAQSVPPEVNMPDKV